MKTSEKPFLFFHFYFILRRLIYVVTSFFLKSLPGIQLIILNYLNLFMTIYLGMYMPMLDRKTNRIEIMNELFVIAATYNVMFFTEFVTDPETRFLTGYWFCAIIVL